MSDLPHTVADFNKARASFEKWLLSKGSAIYAPTNPYEVARFLTDIGVAVVYRDKTDRLTEWTNGGDAAWRAFKTGVDWRARENTRKSRTVTKRANTIRTLLKRDGACCVFCGREMAEQDITVEHIVPATAGGSTHLSNLTLAHAACNRMAAHMSAREKIELAVKMRSAP